MPTEGRLTVDIRNHVLIPDAAQMVGDTQKLGDDPFFYYSGAKSTA